MVDGAQSDSNRVPFNEIQRQSLARLAYVHGQLSGSDRRDLKTFATMMAPIESEDPPSMSEFAGSKTGLADADSSRRVLEGCFVGLLWKLAERLYEVYRTGNFPEKIEIDAS